MQSVFETFLSMVDSFGEFLYFEAYVYQSSLLFCYSHVDGADWVSQLLYLIDQFVRGVRLLSLRQKRWMFLYFVDAIHKLCELFLRKLGRTADEEAALTLIDDQGEVTLWIFEWVLEADHSFVRCL